MSYDGSADRDFYAEHNPVYAPGFGPGEVPSGKPGDMYSSVSMTRQEFAEEADINTFMARYDGAWPPPPPGPPQYLDVSDVPDLMRAQRVLDEAERAFMTLPARVRAEFSNDPVQFVDFATNSANLDRMREWKLAPPAAAMSVAPSAGLAGASGGSGVSSSTPGAADASAAAK